MLTLSEERLAYRAFQWGVLLKGISGAVEAFVGLALLAIRAAYIGRLGTLLFARELAEDPSDFLATRANEFFLGFSTGMKAFVIAYLLIHGAANITLAAGLIKKRPWGYPVALALMGVFLAYQLRQLYSHYSPALLAFAAFDAAVIALVWHQYLHARVGE